MKIGDIKELIENCKGRHQGIFKNEKYCKIILPTEHDMCPYQVNCYVNIRKKNLIVRFECSYEKKKWDIKQ